MAALAPRAPLRRARLVVEQGWSVAQASERYDVSWKTLRSGPRVTGPVQCRINRLTRLDQATGEPIRHYEQERPGDLIHVDFKS
jgi:hypothetical protein